MEKVVIPKAKLLPTKIRKGEKKNAFVSDYDGDTIEVNEFGGMNSRIATRFDLLPFNVVWAVAEVLAKGAEKYGEGNFWKVQFEEHINHAMSHLSEVMKEEPEGRFTKEMKDHLTHFVTRAVLAGAVWLKKRKDILATVIAHEVKKSESYTTKIKPDLSRYLKLRKKDIYKLLPEVGHLTADEERAIREPTTAASPDWILHHETTDGRD